MKVGCIGLAAEQGLGYLLRSFYRAGVVTDVLLVKHRVREPRLDWYPPGTPYIDVANHGGALHRFCEQLDTLLVMETPFLWDVIPYCQQRGVRVVLMPMHECTPERLPHVPDLFLCPSLLDLRCFTGLGVPAVFVPVPVHVPWRKRTRVETFVHNAGHGGLKGRNGTHELYAALPLLKKHARVIVRAQDEHLLDGRRHIGNACVEYCRGTVPEEALWAEGDAFVFPEKFNGLSLPLQEAFASGMAVLATDRFPMNTWLPRAPLIPTEGSVPARVAPSARMYDEAIVRPEAIAAKMDEYNGMDVSQLSELGRRWAESCSWEALKPLYMETLCELR